MSNSMKRTPRIHTRPIFQLARISLILVQVSLLIGHIFAKQSDLWAVGGVAAAIAVLAIIDYRSRVLSTYDTCLDSREMSALPEYERVNFENGKRRIARPPLTSFFARAAWQAGREVEEAKST